MVLIFKLLFTISLTQGLEPEISWYFPALSCTSCVDQQLEIMKQFYRPNDKIIIPLRDDQRENPAVEKMVEKLSRLRPNALIFKRRSNIRGVGWSFFDNLTGEEITMVFRQGSYNTWRALEILNLIRAPH